MSFKSTDKPVTKYLDRTYFTSPVPGQSIIQHTNYYVEVLQGYAQFHAAVTSQGWGTPMTGMLNILKDDTTGLCWQCIRGGEIIQTQTFINDTMATATLDHEHFFTNVYGMMNSFVLRPDSKFKIKEVFKFLFQITDGEQGEKFLDKLRKSLAENEVMGYDVDRVRMALFNTFDELHQLKEQA